MLIETLHHAYRGGGDLGTGPEWKMWNQLDLLSENGDETASSLECLFPSSLPEQPPSSDATDRKPEKPFAGDQALRIRLA